MIGPSSRRGCHEVAGGADELDPALERLAIGLAAGEGRQEAVVDVQDPAGVPLAKRRRQDLHVAGQDHEIRGLGLEQPLELREGLGLAFGFGRDRNVVEGDAVVLDVGPRVRVVRHHAPQVEAELAGAPPVQEIDQAVVLAAHEDHHPPRHFGVADGELHVVTPRQGQEALPELLDPEGQRLRGDLVPHEEPLRVGIGVVAHLGQPAAPGGDEAADRGDEPDTVGAGDGENVAASRVHVGQSNPGRQPGRGTLSGQRGSCDDPSSPSLVAGGRFARRSLRSRPRRRGRRPVRLRPGLGGPRADGRGRLRLRPLPRANPRVAPHFTAEPHPAGSERNHELALYVAEEWKKQGLEDVVIHRYDVLNTAPLEVSLDDGRPGALRGEPPRGARRRRPRHAEPAREPGLPRPLGLGRRRGARRLRPQRQPRGLRGAPEERHRRAGQDRPRPLLEPVQLPRLQGPHRREAAARPAILIYSDPAEDGFKRGPVFPDGPWGPESHIQRGAITYDFIVPGDPLTPGWPSLPGAPPGEAGGGALAPEDRRACRSRGRTRSRSSRTWTAPSPRRTGRAACRSSTASGGDRVRVHLKVRMDNRVAPNYVVEGRLRGDGAARRVGDPRQPPRRVGVRRRRPVERHRLPDGGDAGPRRARPIGQEAAAHARVLLLGRRGGGPHRLHRVGRALRGRARHEGGRLPERRLLGLGPRLPARRGRLPGAPRPRPRAGARGPGHAAAAGRGPPGRGREGEGRGGRHRAARPTTISSTSASAAARTTRSS